MYIQYASGSVGSTGIFPGGPRVILASSMVLPTTEVWGVFNKSRELIP